MLRQVNPSFATHLDLLKSSGILDSGLTLPVEWLGPEAGATPEAIETMRPEPLEFVSHPYEWSFGMLKDAALLTLDLALAARERNLVLKDASAYNVQFQGGAPVHIDSLSFETIVPGEPWVAYGQFCRHFLAPLALMARVDPDLLGLLRIHLDGIPLPLAASLLPGTSKFNAGLAVHLHAHARASGARAEADPGSGPKRAATLSETGHRALLDSLRKTVEGLTWTPEGTTWADYTGDNNYEGESYAAKKSLVGEMLDVVKADATGIGVCWDLGANTGDFSRLAAERGFRTLSLDLDPGAVERNYRAVRERGETRLLPLLQDFSNPSPDLGWAQSERQGLLARADADAILALALIHHLRIGGLVPLTRVAELFADLA
ncbi:SAM-dependent methyltransferase, partial [bacterium]